MSSSTTHGGGEPHGAQRGLFTQLRDPARERQRWLAVGYLAQRSGRDVEEVSRSFESLYVPAYSQSPEGLGLDHVPDEAGFHQGLRIKVHEEKLSQDDFQIAAKAAWRGESLSTALPAWQQQAGLVRGRKNGGLFAQVHEVESKRTAHLRPMANRLFSAMEKNLEMNGTGGLGDAKESWDQIDEVISQMIDLSPAEQKDIYKIISAKAEVAQWKQKGFWRQTGGFLQKQSNRMLSTVGTMLGNGLDLINPSVIGEEQRLARRDRRERHAEIYQQLSDLAMQNMDPIRPTLDWMNDTLETGLMKAPGAVGPSLALSTVASPMVAFGVFSVDFAEQNRRDLRQQGFSPDQARKLGYTAAPIQGLTESLGNLFGLGKLPAVNRFLSRLTKPITSGQGVLGRYLIHTGIQGGVQFSEEQLQDNVVIPTMQGLFRAVGEDMPEVDWSYYRNRAIESSPELGTTLLPMVLLFGGRATVRDVRLSKQMTTNPRMLELAGFDAQQAQEIQSQASEADRIAKARELWQKRAGTPQSIEAAATVLAQEQKQEQDAAFQALNELEAGGALPRLGRTPQGWHITLPTHGTRMDFANYSEAEAARWRWAREQGLEMGETLPQTAENFRRAQAAKAQTASAEADAGAVSSSTPIEVAETAPKPVHSRVPAFLQLANNASEPTLTEDERRTEPAYHEREDRDPGRALARLRESAAGQRPTSPGQTGGRDGEIQSVETSHRLETLNAGPLERGIGSLEAKDGAEHDVFFDPDSNRAIKLTNPGEFGAEDLGLEGYLQRLAWSNELFDDDIKIEGFVLLSDEARPRVVTTQPWYRADEASPQPSQPEIDAYMRAKGFLKAYDGAYLHESRDIAASDALPKNFIRDQEGHVHPVDVVLVEPSSTQHERLQDMVNNQPQLPGPTNDGNRRGAGHPAENEKLPAANPYRDANGSLRVPERASSRSDPALAPYEEKLKKIVDDQTQADRLYNALPDAKGGKVIGTDIARELLPEFASGREGKIRYTNATGRVAQAYAKDRLWREIENRNGRKVLMFTAGGVAAGKSTAVTDEQVALTDLVFDGTLRETDWAIQTIERALEKGWLMEINYVQRPLDLVIPGAIKRANDGGRWGALADLPAIHQAAQESAVKIAKRFASDPNVDVYFWLNDGKTTAEKPRLLTLEQIDAGGEYSYDENHERKTIHRGGEEGEAGTFHQGLRSRRAEEVRRLFTEAVRSGRYEPRVLGLLAEGNAELEQILRRELGGNSQQGPGEHASPAPSRESGPGDTHRQSGDVEARWARKPLPPGADPAVAAEWRKRLEGSRVPNPVSSQEVIVWDHNYPTIADFRHKVESAAQTLLDLLPREVMEKVGKFTLQLKDSLPGGAAGSYNPRTGILSLSQRELNVMREGDLRALLWHEMGHWLYFQAGAHPRLQKWRAEIHNHWANRVQGERIETSPEGWRFIRDGWLRDYAGRLYPDRHGGLEIPSVYLEEVADGPENIADRCDKFDATETFEIVTSIFGN